MLGIYSNDKCTSKLFIEHWLIQAKNESSVIEPKDGFILLIFDKYPDGVIPSITTKPNILQKTLFNRICSKFIKV